MKTGDRILTVEESTAARERQRLRHLNQAKRRQVDPLKKYTREELKLLKIIQLRKIDKYYRMLTRAQRKVEAINIADKAIKNDHDDIL